ncbi:MAG: ribonuclease III [Microscillaceae bacterium]|nr:ribonuclease III [Microscillaceae bacterium]MDW8459754.1 ribonuclease III [Cytophagales bacterium]
MLFNVILSWFRKYPAEDKALVQAIQQIIGIKPKNLALYKLAVSHASISKLIVGTEQKDSNERLEYLGDAILGAIVAEYLFKKFPFKGEGFLTEIRSRIVNREALNHLAQKIGLLNIVRYEKHKHKALYYKSIGGDALEALIGAIYLDKGFATCKKVVLNKFIQPHIDIEQIVQSDYNFKSKIIEWAQREGKDVRFETEERGSKSYKEFITSVYINNQPIAIGKGTNKKRAEQAAAEKACEQIGI